MDHRRPSSRRLPLRAGLIVAGLLLALPAFAAAHAPRHRSPLESVAALDQPVTYSETKIPLGELVQKVAADTGAPLTAAPDVADEPVAIVVKDVPARELLEQTADLLDYRWSRRGRPGGRYEIWQDLASKQREEALRRRMIAGVAASLRDQLRQYGFVARLSQAQRQAVLDADERRSQELEKQTAEQQRTFYYSREGYEAFRRCRAADAVAKAVPRVQADLLSRLPPEQWAALWRDQRLVFSSHPGPGEFPLPEEIAGGLRAARPSASPFQQPVAVRGTVVEQASPSEEDQQSLWATAAGYTVTVRLQLNQLRSHGCLGLEASAQPLLGARAADSFSFRPWDCLDISFGPGDYDPLIQDDPPGRRAALEKDPFLDRRARFRPTARASRDVDGPGAGDSWQVHDLLPDLARAYGANFISDAYWSAEFVSSAQLSSEPQPLYQCLDALCLPHQRWDRRGNLIRIRSRTWFMERPREVPLRFVRRWSESYCDRGGLLLDEYLQMATGLRDSQLAALEEVVGVLIRLEWLPRVAEELSGVYPARYALRLYASLSPEQRQQLAAGQALPFSATTFAQRPLFLAALEDMSVRQHAESLASSPLAHWAETRFLASSSRYTLVQLEDGVRILRPEPDSRPAGRPDVADRDQGAVSLPSPVPLPAAARPSPDSRVPGRGGTPAIPWGARERSSLIRIELELNAGPDLHEAFALPVAAFPW